MTDEEAGSVVPIDPEVRDVLAEFDGSPIALASEIVRLRTELEAARWARPHVGIDLPTPEPPGHGPPPTRFGI